MEKNEEKKKGGFFKKTLKVALLIGAGVGIGIAISKPERTKQLANKAKGLFDKKDAAPVAANESVSVDPETGIIGDNISELDAQRNNDRRENNNRGGFNHNNHGFNRH